MAMTAALTQVQPAQMGRPTTFQVAISNSGGSTVNVYSIQPMARTAAGARYDAVNFGALMAPPALSSAQVGGYQMNVPVTAGSTVYFTFEACIYGPSVSGGPTQPNMQFQIDVACLTSDGSVFNANSALLVNLNQPQFGQAPGAPPNPTASVGQLDFQSPFASALTL